MGPLQVSYNIDIAERLLSPEYDDQVPGRKFPPPPLISGTQSTVASVRSQPALLS